MMTTNSLKANLLYQMQNGYANFITALSGLDEATLLIPGVVGVWSIKDILAHIAAHQQRMLRWLEQCAHGETPDLPAPYGMQDEPLAALNELLYLTYRDWSLAEVQRELELQAAACQRFVAQAAEDLLFDPQRASLPDGEPLQAAVAANTYEHYAEHLVDIHKWLNRRASRGS
jgi:hypothetical protein